MDNGSDEGTSQAGEFLGCAASMVFFLTLGIGMIFAAMWGEAHHPAASGWDGWRVPIAVVFATIGAIVVFAAVRWVIDWAIRAIRQRR